MDTNELSRRQLLVRGSFAAMGARLALSTPTRAQALDDAGTDGGVDAGVTAPSPASLADNLLLNSLLRATFDAIATYGRGLTIFSADASTSVAARMAYSELALAFQDHHKQHASALKLRIESTLGSALENPGTSELPGSFPLAPKTADFIRLAADKERLGAIQCAAAIEQLTQASAARLVASLGAVRAQHFAVLYLLAEGLLQTNASTGASAKLIVPTAFAVDPGASLGTHLAMNPQLDQLLALEAPA
jgi:hypothetical protein